MLDYRAVGTGGGIGVASRILVDKLTLSQPWGTLFPPHYYVPPPPKIFRLCDDPAFQVLPTALYSIITKGLKNGEF